MNGGMFSGPCVRSGGKYRAKRTTGLHRGNLAGFRNTLRYKLISRATKVRIVQRFLQVFWRHALVERWYYSFPLPVFCLFRNLWNTEIDTAPHRRTHFDVKRRKMEYRIKLTKECAVAATYRCARASISNKSVWHFFSFFFEKGYENTWIIMFILFLR